MLAQGLYLSCSWSISLASFLIKLLFSFYTSSCHSFLYSQTLLIIFLLHFLSKSVFVSSTIIAQMCLRMPTIKGTGIGRKLGTWSCTPIQSIQTRSKGDMSGDYASHARTSRYFLQILAVLECALSYCNRS